MRKILAVFIIIAVVGGGLFYASPYRAFKAMKEAVDDDDSERLSLYIDYPVLRENLKAQLRDGVDSYLEGDGKEENPFAALGSALMGGFADNLVDEWVTPDGVAQLMRGASDLQGGPDSGRDEGDKDEDDDLLRDARLRFRSLSEVEVVAKNQDDLDVRFVLTRAGLSWQLTNIILPLDDLQ